MTRKCCLNCAYLCQPDGSPNKISWGDHLRQHAGPAEIQSRAHCYHEQWIPHPITSQEDVSAILGEKVYASMDPPNQWKVNVASGGDILLKEHRCKYFHAYDTHCSKPLDRIWQEHQQQRQEGKDRRRFWITTAILTATALAVGLSAFFDLLEWSRTP